MTGKIDLEVETLNLKRLQRQRAAEPLEAVENLLAQFDFLTDLRVFLKENVNVEVARTRRNRPRHAANHLVKRRKARDACAEIAACQKQIENLLIFLFAFFVYTHIGAARCCCI
jgi:hypothetical protein